jgi:hypothetical protein
MDCENENKFITAACLARLRPPLLLNLADSDVMFNPLTPNDLKRRRAGSPLKIKIPCKNMRENPTNTPIIHSVY